MFSWFSFGKKNAATTNADPTDLETTPLLDPKSGAETQLQAHVYDKIHTYLLFRALSKGYLPSTAQACAHLRSLLSTDFLNPSNTHLTPDGRKLVRDMRRLITAFAALLEKKNGADQLQEFLWCTRRARLGFDGGELVDAAEGIFQGIGGSVAEMTTGMEALQTVADLLMTNADFRELVKDATIVARQVLADTAMTGGQVVQTVGETVRPKEAELEGINEVTPAEATEEPSGHEETSEDAVMAPAQEAGKALAEGITETAEAAVESAQRELQDEGHGYALLERMKMVVLRLRGREDYTQSVNIISVLLKRYALIYSRSMTAAASTTFESIQPNSALDRAVEIFWSLIMSFGDASEWNALQELWGRFLRHLKDDKELETLMEEIGVTIQDVLTDPSFLEPGKIEEKLVRLRELARGIGTDTTAKEDLDLLLSQAENTLNAVLNDSDIAALISISKSIFRTVWPTPYTVNPAILSDFTHVLFPLALQMIQYIPLIRITIATPEVDLLIENLILEPGDTVNGSSFFPNILRLEARNDFELRKGRQRYASEVTSQATVKLNGLAVRADEVGYWMKVHTGVWRFWDEGIVSVMMDGQGADVSLDLEFGRDRIENLIALRAVDVKLHKFDYAIKRSRFRWLVWPFKPILKPILKRILKKQMEARIAELCHFINREMVFARERLRATRVAQPASLYRFVKAVAARLGPEPSKDVEVTLGVRSSKTEDKQFENRYAPGSIVKLWEDHGETVTEVVDAGAEGGWRNAVFELKYTREAPAGNA
ncbi:hypothetical protein FN846DRAFT_898606 [Sphaerosporella brunnea]|uniref:HAM1-like N-terminal domain-containing protein n=1 Tax=Sphaerosporella brunnea TaxID=1250544 RepID=A0A5J5EZ64_9PEZI|nr:hypothetical protein FN846DRAFT_898606 [Sphaerosporella brunnea]